MISHTLHTLLRHTQRMPDLRVRFSVVASGREQRDWLSHGPLCWAPCCYKVCRHCPEVLRSTRQDVRCSSQDPSAWFASLRPPSPGLRVPAPSILPELFPVPFPHVACSRVGQAGDTWPWVVLLATQWTEPWELLRPKTQEAEGPF